MKPRPSLRAALAPQQGDAERSWRRRLTARPAGTALDAIIEQNLVRLNDGVDGRFAAEIADYGDLDGDGLDDGLVFFTYELQRLGQARFVAAYLFDGESYALAATKPLAGSDDSVHSAEIELIEDGVISLRLNVLEPGDAACCPSGLRRQELVLRGGQLIEARTACERPETAPRAAQIRARRETAQPVAGTGSAAAGCADRRGRRCQGTRRPLRTRLGVGLPGGRLARGSRRVRAASGAGCSAVTGSRRSSTGTAPTSAICSRK